jgi:hypothetical protein
MTKGAPELAARAAPIAAAERGSVPIHNETVADFGSRQQRLSSERDYAERVADELLLDVDLEMQMLRERIESPGGLGLSAREWQQAGQLMPLATARLEHAPLSAAVAELRSALASHAKPRIAAFLTAFEAGLAAAKPAPSAEGKTHWPEHASPRSLRGLIAEATHQVRNTSLDRARDEYRELVGASGDLSVSLATTRVKRKLQAKIDEGEKVPWPPKETSTDGMTRLSRQWPYPGLEPALHRFGRAPVERNPDMR